MKTEIIDGLIDRWEEMLDHGTPLTIEELCSGHPELAPEVRRRIEALQAMDSAHGYSKAGYGLAASYRSAGRLPESIKMHEGTLQSHEAKLGSDHRETLVSRNNLAIAYAEAAQWDKAIPVFEEVLRDTPGQRIRARPRPCRDPQ